MAISIVERKVLILKQQQKLQQEGEMKQNFVKYKSIPYFWQKFLTREIIIFPLTNTTTLGKNEEEFLTKHFLG